MGDVIMIYYDDVRGMLCQQTYSKKNENSQNMPEYRRC